MKYSPGVLLLSQQLGLDAEHVAEAFKFVARTHTAMQASQYSHMTDSQFRRLVGHDRFPIAIIANIAMRMAGRIDDANLLMDIYKASTGAIPHRAYIRPGTGSLPQHHSHPYVQQAIRILQAAHLPPIVTNGTHELRPGFKVLPSGDHLPGWILIAPDPYCDDRRGFAGGRLGYLAVMRWAGWGVITEPMPNGLWAVVHPDYRNNPLPS